MLRKKRVEDSDAEHTQFPINFSRKQKGASHVEQKHASMEYALKAGLRIVAGTDSFMGDVRFDALPDEIRCMVEYDCTPMQAIQSATLWAAQSMGWADIGAIKAGKLADMIAIDGNPLADIRAVNKVTLVVREGKIIKNQLSINRM